MIQRMINEWMGKYRLEHLLLLIISIIYVIETAVYRHESWLFVLYLLTANLLAYLWNKPWKKSMGMHLSRTVVVSFLVLTIGLVNLPLIGNYFYSYKSRSPIPGQVLYQSNFTFTNLYVYRDLAVSQDNVLR